ncbi:MAG TPA: Asp-tRNA(Asn)/Glu-tRNA(Gln) amidotransferase subunit GatC [Bellilinea sp.]|nr:Asp-tRNA(Asn)/Glu-tRNA(Gln) amidotransferase subunit GatC [Bellilinea sp.]
MSEKIDKETFDHLVRLASLELTETEAEYLRAELNAQLSSIRELAAIPLDDGVPASLHGLDYPAAESALLREDEWQPSQYASAILNQAPETHDGYIVVPDIPHQTLK